MPIKRCTLPNGGSGFKYGNSGKCYSKRSDAIKQMQAIKVSQQRSKSEFTGDISLFKDLIAEAESEEDIFFAYEIYYGDKYKGSIAFNLDKKKMEEQNKKQ